MVATGAFQEEFVSKLQRKEEAEGVKLGFYCFHYKQKTVEKLCSNNLKTHVQDMFSSVMPLPV